MLSIIIPVYNEKGTLLALLEKLDQLSMPHEVILVDDGSTDGTWDILTSIQHRQGYTVLQHSENRGKGAAVQTGLKQARGQFCVIQDADLEYDPNDLNIMYERIARDPGREIAVFGARQLARGGPKWAWSFYWGNQLLTRFARLLYRIRMTDLSTCYKMVRTDWLKSASLQSTKFEFCEEVTAKLCKQGIAIVEVPISYRPRSEGKKIRWRDGFRALWALLRYRF